MSQSEQFAKLVFGGLIQVHLDNYKASGAELIMGTGRFIALKTMEVSSNEGGIRTLTAGRVVLNLARPMPRVRV